jgi:hypothetical protein
VRVVSKARLWEVSLVAWGANPLAKVREVNARQRAARPPPPKPAAPERFELVPASELAHVAQVFARPMGRRLELQRRGQRDLMRVLHDADEKRRGSSA